MQTQLIPFYSMRSLLPISALFFILWETSATASVLEATPEDEDVIEAGVRVKRGGPLARCGQGFQFTRQKSPLELSSEGAPPGQPCEWALFGDPNCKPQVLCQSVKMKKEEDCPDEYILVSDGVGGEIRLCGNVKFDKPLVASAGSRDLFIRFQQSKGASPFKCSATCIKDVDAILQLPTTFKQKEDTRCVCGLQNKDDRIVGGEDAKMNEFPWQAAVVYNGTRIPKCGATLINERYILTAAHCFWFDKMKASEIEVLLHAYQLELNLEDNADKNAKLGEEGSIRGKGYDFKPKTDADENTQRYRVAEITMHPLFSESYDYDYAVLRLEKKIDLSDADAPTPICLPPPNSFKETFEGQKPWVVGWGKPDEKAASTTKILQKLQVPVIPLSTCQDWLPGAVTQRMLCAGFEEGNKDACTGDSGGPLILKQANKQWWQIGVVSWGEGCAQRRKPGLYSRVTEMYQWITYHANKKDPKWCKWNK